MDLPRIKPVAAEPFESWEVKIPRTAICAGGLPSLPTRKSGTRLPLASEHSQATVIEFSAFMALRCHFNAMLIKTPSEFYQNVEITALQMKPLWSVDCQTFKTRRCQCCELIIRCSLVSTRWLERPQLGGSVVNVACIGLAVLDLTYSVEVQFRRTGRLVVTQ